MCQSFCAKIPKVSLLPAEHSVRTLTGFRLTMTLARLSSELPIHNIVKNKIRYISFTITINLLNGCVLSGRLLPRKGCQGFLCSSFQGRIHPM